MSQLVFLVEQRPDGRYIARALGVDLFAHADTLDELRENVCAAVRGHFGNGPARPQAIHLHQVHDEIIRL